MGFKVGDMYQGVKINDVDTKVKSRHPRWGYDPKKMPLLEEASLLLLEDGIFVVVCTDGDCTYNGITGSDPYNKPEGEQKPIIKQADSVMAHKSGTHWLKAPRGSMYDEDLIKAAIKIWLKWNKTGLKKAGQAACDELERLGFKPYRAEHWNPGQLSALVSTYIKRDKFKNLKAAQMSDEDRTTLAEMVREAADREEGNGTLGANARITSKPKDDKEEDEPVAGHEVPVPSLVFGKKVGSANAVTLDTEDVPVSPAPTLAVVKSDYEHVTEMDDGTPLFRYKGGSLLAGRPVKGVEF